MNASPLQIDFYFIEALRWEIEREFEPTEAQPLTVDDLSCDLQSNAGEGPRQTSYRLTLGLPSSAGRFAYSFDMVLIGGFHVTEDVPQQYVAQVLDANAPALLYSAAREALATSLARGPFAPPLLPAVNFLNLERQPKAETVTPEALPEKATKRARKTTPKKSKTD